MRWQTKSRILKVFDYLPARLFFLLSKKIMKTGGITITPEGLPEAWVFVEQALRSAGAQSSVEFGAGRHLAINQWFSSFLKQQVVVDIDRMIDMDLVRQVNADLRAHGFLADAARIDAFDDLQRLGIDYRAPCNLLDLPEAEKFDVSFSISTWEHVPQELIPVLLKKLKSLLKPGGLIVAHIDYSDHYAHGDSTLDRLHFLAYSQADWARHNHRHLFQNRLRHKQYQQIFEACGLQVLTAEASVYVTDPKLPPLTENLTGDDSDFATTGRWVLQVGADYSVRPLT